MSVTQKHKNRREFDTIEIIAAKEKNSEWTKKLSVWLSELSWALVEERGKKSLFAPRPT